MCVCRSIYVYVCVCVVVCVCCVFCVCCRYIDIYIVFVFVYIYIYYLGWVHDFSNIRIFYLIIEYRLGCAIIF